MFCEQCGTKLNDGAKFCTSCGAKVSGDIPAPVYPNPQPWGNPQPNGGQTYNPGPYTQNPVNPPVKPPKKISTGALIGIIAGGLAVILIILALCGVFGSGAKGYSTQEKLIEAYFDAIEDNDYDEVLDMFAPDLVDYAKKVYSTETDRDTLYWLDDWLYECYGLEAEDWYIYDVDEYDMYDIEDAEEVLGYDIDKYVDVWVVVNFENGEEYDIDFDMIKTGNKWYLVDVW